MIYKIILLYFANFLVDFLAITYFKRLTIIAIAYCLGLRL